MVNRKLILYTLAVINFTHIVDSMLIMPMGDIFIEEFQISAHKYSYLIMAYAFAAFLSSGLGFFFLDTFDRKKALLFTYIGFSVGTFACAFADTYELLVGIRFLTGLFGGFIGALVLSIVSDLYKFKERGTAIGVIFAAFSAASALGIPIGLYLAVLGSWQTPFIIIGSLGFVITVLIFFLFPSMTTHFESVDKSRSMMDTIRTLTSDQNQMIALLTGFIIILGHFLIIPFISPYMIKNVGLTQLEISYQFFFGGVATIFSGPLVGRFVDKIGVFKVFLTMLLLSTIPTMLIVTLPESNLILAVFIVVLFFVTASGRMIPANTLISAAASQENRGSFMSMKSALQQLAIALASLISGLIIFINPDGKFENYPILGVLSILILSTTIVLIRKLKVAKDN